MDENIFSKTLTTGCGGMVGSYVNFGVRTDRNSLDITNLADVLAVCRKYRPAVIVHLAAETDVDRCDREPDHAYLVNGIGTYHMAVAAKDINATLVYVSTNAVFDGTKDGPYVETDEPNPINAYGRSKYVGELAVRGMLSDYLIVRIAWAFGGGPEKDQKFVGKIVRKLDQPEIAAVDDTKGSPSYGKDVIGGIQELLRRGERGIVHLTNAGSATRYDMASFIGVTLRPSISVVRTKSDRFPDFPNRSRNEMLVSRLSIMRPWQDALREYLETEWK